MRTPVKAAAKTMKSIAKVSTSSKIKYAILAPVFSSVMFFVFYYFGIKDVSDNWQRFWLILLDSYVTGLVGSILARLMSGFWNLEISLKFYMSNFLISLFYAIFIYFGGIYIFVLQPNWATNMLTMIIIRYLIHISAELIAIKTTKRFSTLITG